VCVRARACVRACTFSSKRTHSISSSRLNIKQLYYTIGREHTLSYENTFYFFPQTRHQQPRRPCLPPSPPPSSPSPPCLRARSSPLPRPPWTAAQDKIYWQGQNILARTKYIGKVKILCFYMPRLPWTAAHTQSHMNSDILVTSPQAPTSPLRSCVANAYSGYEHQQPTPNKQIFEHKTKAPNKNPQKNPREMTFESGFSASVSSSAFLFFSSSSLPALSCGRHAQRSVP
jgi:hypothetical protein